MRKKPIVGLNCSLRHSETVGVKQSFILEYYYDSVSEAGGLPVLLPPLAKAEDVREAAGLLKALVLVGGDDINPAQYGQPRHDKTSILESRREEFDFILAREALGRGLPLLAICGGCQLLNVALGGTLHQHLPDVYGAGIAHSRSDEMLREGKDAMHEANVLPETLLHQVLRVQNLQVNSSHHQSVDMPAEGLRVSARAPDGVVEALEWLDWRKKPFMLAVQWHPERLKEMREHMLLFEALIEAGRK
jgi:putative glutamine amidotransferase